MIFKLFGKRKKYPHNKKAPPPTAVYAGPEYFRQKHGGRIYAGPEVPRGGGDDEVLDVYAGPEFFGGPEEEPEEDGLDGILRLVYAGPEYFRKKAEEKETELPVGPEFFDGPPPEAEEGEERFYTVYAGPEPDGPQAPEAPVYAGPKKL